MKSWNHILKFLFWHHSSIGLRLGKQALSGHFQMAHFAWNSNLQIFKLALFTLIFTSKRQINDITPKRFWSELFHGSGLANYLQRTYFAWNMTLQKTQNNLNSQCKLAHFWCRQAKWVQSHAYKISSFLHSCIMPHLAWNPIKISLAVPAIHAFERLANQ